MNKYVLRPKPAIEAMQVTETNQTEVHNWMCIGTNPEMFARPTKLYIGFWYALRTDVEFRDFYVYSNDDFTRLYEAEPQEEE